MMLSPKSVYVWEIRHQDLHPLRQILRLAAALRNLLHLIVVRREASRNQLPWRALAGAWHNLLRQNSFQATQDAFSTQKAVALHNLLLVAKSLGQR
jgi:hypothetical protein